LFYDEGIILFSPLSFPPRIVTLLSKKLPRKRKLHSHRDSFPGPVMFLRSIPPCGSPQSKPFIHEAFRYSGVIPDRCPSTFTRSRVDRPTAFDPVITATPAAPDPRSSPPLPFDHFFLPGYTAFWPENFFFPMPSCTRAFRHVPVSTTRSHQCFGLFAPFSGQAVLISLASAAVDKFRDLPLVCPLLCMCKLPPTRPRPPGDSSLAYAEFSATLRRSVQPVSTGRPFDDRPSYRPKSFFPPTALVTPLSPPLLFQPARGR